MTAESAGRERGGEDGPTNATLFSEGMWQSYFFIAPASCFENEGVYTIPFTYMNMADFVDATPVAWTFYRSSNNKYEPDQITFSNFIDLLIEQPSLINADIHWRKQSDPVKHLSKLGNTIVSRHRLN